MDDLITGFISMAYTESAGEDIFQSLGLFQLFNHTGPILEISNLLARESYIETSQIADGVVEYVRRGQKLILDHHGISLSDESTLAFDNTVLRTLYQLQKLEDPLPVLRIIESTDNDEYKLCRILEMFSSLSIEAYLQMVEEVRPVFMMLLAEFLYAQEDKDKEAVFIPQLIAEKTKAFKEVFDINPAVRIIIDSGVVMGEDFVRYMPIFDELRETVEDEKILVETLLFLLIYSHDGVKDPMGVFANHSLDLAPDIDTAQRLTRTLGEMYNKINQVKKVTDNEA